MNLILKIVRGPNAGAESALVEGMNIKLGRGDECDIVLADQSLPDVACEIEVGAERAMLLLPGGGQERLEPLHVRMFETTGIAIGPADAPWGSLVWPEQEAVETEKTQEKAEESVPADNRPGASRNLLPWLLAAIVLLLILEFTLWLFWPFFNSRIALLREFGLGAVRSLAGSGRAAGAAVRQPRWNSLEELANAYGVEVVPPAEEGGPEVLRGNLKTSAERLKLTAEAYSLKPGIAIDLADDESLGRASSELLAMVAGNSLKVEKAEGRELSISGKLGSLDELRHVLEALGNDVPRLENIDCSRVEIAAADMRPVQAVEGTVSVPASPPEKEPPAQPVEATAAAGAPAVAESQPPPPSRLPVVGVMTTPVPYLVLRNGSRVLEGAEFNGYVVSRISEDVILLKNGDETIEWRP